jgi:PIN domain nuclease of toxin-antitoxin system
MSNGPVMPRTSEPQALLLDTHIWLWVVAGWPELSMEVRGAVGMAIGRGVLRISAISLWEIAMLASRGRIVLGKPIGLWLDEALADPGPEIEPLTPRIAVESCELPDAFQADPADRMIVATARVTNATLVTRDRQILDYAARGHLTVLPA